jgi:hypothetical protein
MMREKLEALAKDWAADKDGMMSYAYAAHELRAILNSEEEDQFVCLLCGQRFQLPAREHPDRGQAFFELVQAGMVHHGPDGKPCIGHISKATRPAPAAIPEGLRWIPVGERLPEEFVRVIVLLSDGEAIEVHLGEQRGGKWGDRTGGEWMQGVVKAWLPEPIDAALRGEAGK